MKSASAATIYAKYLQLFTRSQCLTKAPDGLGWIWSDPLPATPTGERYVIVVTHYLTKWPEAAALPNKKGLIVADFIGSLICHYGSMETIITDQGTEFCNKVNDLPLERFTIGHNVCSPYHPQSNGLTERFNQTLVNCQVNICESKSRRLEYVHRSMSSGLPYFRTEINQASIVLPCIWQGVKAANRVTAASRG